MTVFMQQKARGFGPLHGQVYINGDHSNNKLQKCYGESFWYEYET